MGLSNKPYKGCRDFFPADQRKRDYLFNTMKVVAEKFGFEPYDGPLLEEVELYLAKSGQELINEQIYSFKDRGDRFVAIRPEMTPTVARMVSQIHREVSKPLRWYSIPNLMRYEQPQKGRLREHWQLNCDIFGAPQNLGEIEVFQVIIDLMKEFKANASHFGILINDRQVVDAIFKKLLKLTDEQSYKLYKIIDKSKKVSAEALQKMLSEVITDTNAQTLFKEYLALKNFTDLKTYLSKHNLGETVEPFMKMVTQLENLKMMEYISYDPTIVRGLDYYTGVVFEVFDKHPDNRRAIAGGGSYANLLQIFGEQPLPGVGFGMGDVTLADFLTVHNLMPNFDKPQTDVLVAYLDEAVEAYAFEVSTYLRTKYKTELFLGATNPKKAFTASEKKGHSHIVILGQDEKNSQNFELKNLKTKTSQKMTLKDTL